MAGELASGRGAAESIAVLPFTDADGAPSETGARIARRLLTELVRGRRVKVVERELMSQLLAEHSLGATGVLDQSRLRALGSFAPADALLAGSYAATGRGLLVHARLVDVESGVVLAASERTLDEEAQAAEVALLASAFGFDVAVPALTVPVPSLDGGEPLELRDAPADRDPCDGAARRVDRLQADILDLKARYWARRRRVEDMPGMDPGASFLGHELRSRFYARLAQYSSSRRPPRLSPEEVKRFVAADREAFHLRRDCGL